MQPKVFSIDPHRLADSRPLFANVTTSTGPGRFVTTAGQVGADENGNVPDDPDEQIKLAFENLGRCIIAAGASVTDILKLVYYIVNYDSNQRRHAKHMTAFLKGHRPATTLVPVSKLGRPDFVFEVEAYIYVPQNPLREADVVVIGAGLSGLKAAFEVQRAGYSCVVVEARDRVGGKTYSVDNRDDGKIVELGAAWINDSNQSEVIALVRALGLSTVEQNTNGNVMLQDFDRSISHFPYGSAPTSLCKPDGAKDIATIIRETEKACQKLDPRDPLRFAENLDDISFEEWVKSQGCGRSALASARIWTGAMLGLEPSQISALYFLNYCRSGGGLLQMRSDKKDGGQFLRLKEGTMSLSSGLASLLKADSIVLNSPVRIVQQLDNGVLVTAGKGNLMCKQLIISVPTPLYKEILFQPPLPAAKMELCFQNKLGYINKVIVSYKDAWWRAKGFCGMLQSFTGPVLLTRDTSVDDAGEFSLTCFTVGDGGRELSKLPRKERFQVVAEHIKETLGAGINVPEPTVIQEYDWSDDQWAQGAPCPASPPGVMTKFEHALRTSHYRIHFVGTETAYEWRGYMEGALLSGIRGAKEVVKVLDSSKL